MVKSWINLKCCCNSEYENEYEARFDGVYASCDGSFKTERAKRWVEEIMRRRPVM